jgi:hypothetical protein
MNKRIGNVEVRFTDEIVGELVWWHNRKDQSEYCIVIAHMWPDKKEGDSSMHTVGERWLDCYKECPREVIALTEYAHTIIRAQLKLEDRMN